MQLLPAIASGQPTLNTIHHCDALTLLKALPSNSIDCCVTSPPYFGLRNYGVDGQIGLEKTPAEYVQTLVTLFREVRRVLKDSGTFWLNLGDSYNGGGSHHGLENTGISKSRIKNGTDWTLKVDNLPSKNLLLIPHRVAIALQDDGWIVRQDNVWHKPNPMPESVTDRTTRAHEYVFQFAKSARYYYNADAVKEPAQNWGERDRTNGKYHNEGTGLRPHTGLKGKPTKEALLDSAGNRNGLGESALHFTVNEKRNKRSVWTIPPAPFRDAHFATFPLELPEICIRAGCPRGGVVLDPFMGSGTVALVARAEGCDYIGSELNSEYITIARRRLAQPWTPMFAELAG